MKKNLQRNPRQRNLTFILLFATLLAATVFPLGSLSKSGGPAAELSSLGGTQSGSARAMVHDPLSSSHLSVISLSSPNLVGVGGVFQSLTPSISNISPSTTTPGSFSLTINGSNFNTSTAQIVVTGPNCPTTTSCVVSNNVLTSKSSNQIVGPLTINTTGSFTIQVQNGSGATLSNSATLTVTTSITPSISNISPSTVTTGTFSLTINGSNFNTSTAQIVVTGPNCPTTSSCVVPNGVLTSKSSSQIVGPITINTSGSFTIQVQNGSGTLSNGANLTVNAPATPAISNISPTVVTPGTFSLTINGSNFNTSTAQIVVTGPNCPTTTSCVVPNGVLTSKSSNQIVGPVTINSTGTFTIQVQNGSGTTLSNGTTLTVNPVTPSITNISPTSVSPGTFSLTISGGNFDTSSAQIVVTGPNCPTTSSCVVSNGVLTSKSSNQIVGPVTINTAGTFTIQVQNGSGTTLSNGATLTVQSPNPVMNSISPTTVTTGSFSLTINGGNFNTSTAQIVVTGPNCPTTSSCVVPNGVLTTKSTNQIVAPVTINTAGTFTIQVQNGSGTTLSNGVPLTVNSPVTPSISSISPTNVTTGTFSLTVSGGNFDPSTAQLVVTGPNCPTTSSCVVPNGVLTGKSSSQIVGPVTINTSGTFTIQVQNGSSGTLSNGMTLTVNAPTTPSISSISPTTTTAGAFSLTINGNNFDASTAQIVVTGPNCPTTTSCVVSNGVLTNKNASQIIGPVTINNAGSFTIQVQNGSGGTLSNGATLVVNSPLTPSISSISPTTVSTGAFSLTINGSNFDASTSQVVVTGPNCPTTSSCVVPNGVLTTKSSNQLVGPVTINTTGTFTVRVQNGASGTLTNGMMLTVNSVTALNPRLAISPTTGTLGVTSFTESYSGFTHNGTITENVTYPNGGLTVYHLTSDSNGSANISFALQSQPGNYSSSAVDDATGTRSNTITYTVSSSVTPHISITPTTGTLGTTSFTESYSGFSRNCTITENVTYPNGGVTVYHVTADGNGNASASFVLQSQFGNYSSFAVDDGTGTRSNTITYSLSSTAHSSPTISSTSPTTPTTSGTDQDVAVYGNNFQPNLTVSINFPSGGGPTLSGAQIANVTSSSFLMHITVNGAGAWSIRVNNPDGGQSSPFNLSVIDASALPNISLVQSSTGADNPSAKSQVKPQVVAGSSQTLTVTGTNFKPALTVEALFPTGQAITLQGTNQILNLSPNSFTLSMALPYSGTYSIRVKNPDGGQSNSFPFPVGSFDSQTCTVNLPVQFSQVEGGLENGQFFDWASEQYATCAGCTIHDLGCYMTSLAMALRYNGIDTNPDRLNQFMILHGGYDGDGNLSSIPTIVSSISGKSLQWVAPGSKQWLAVGSSTQQLKQLLCNGFPAIVRVLFKNKSGKSSPHFVLVTGMNADKFVIADPLCDSNLPKNKSICKITDQRTLDAYDNSFQIRGYVKSTNSNTSAAAGNAQIYSLNDSADKSALNISVEGNAELLLIDPAGRRTGFDPVTASDVEEIPNSGYFRDSLSDPDTGTLTTPTQHSLIVSQPLAGVYKLIVTGQESGISNVSISSLAVDGSVQPNASIVSVNQTGTTAIYQISFASTPVNTVQLTSSAFSVGEGSGRADITVTRSGDASISASVNYATSNGTAKEGVDYVAAQGVLNFAAGETSKTFPVLIIDNAFVDGARTVNLTLSNPTGAGLSAQSTAVLTINDNDTVIGLNPLDAPRSFVQSNYYDFFGRYPDQSGWDFWTNQITSCGSNSQCIDVTRINVSAAFFLSIEFQQTGYLVARMYKTAYGDATGNSTFGGAHQLAVPIVRFDEFLRDTQRIGQGVVVLAPGWEQLLENNKQTFAAEFVQRVRFTNVYPTSMSPAQFVDKLNQNAGNVLSSTERTAAINLFSGAADTSNVNARAQAVRQVAEDADLYNAESNRAFVLSEYFGYLRRNPNDAPEPTLDYSGYDFWLTKLNQFNGNYINAEMVKAFISSTEYRQRFGP